MGDPRFAMFLGAAVLAGCEARVDTVATPIVGGAPSTPGQFSGVGALFYEGVYEGTPVAQVACSGTLIAPDVVLTAAHCLDPYLISMVGLPTFSVANDTFDPTTVWTTATLAVVHESYVTQAVFHIYLETPYDVALLMLSEPIDGVEPMRIATAFDSNFIEDGLALEIAGYGQTVAGDNTTIGVEHFASSEVTEVGDTEIRHSVPGTPQICLYDSGGPNFAMINGERRIVGINSHLGGMLLTCVEGGISERIDVYADWIISHAPGVCDFNPGACGGPLEDAGPPDAATGPDAPGNDNDSGGCQAGGPASLLTGLGLALVAWRRRRATTSPSRPTA